LKIELESLDTQTIAEKVVELIKPYLLQRPDQQHDIVFDVPGLCEYLHVTSKWVYERTHLKQIPYYPLSNKQIRFRKRDIDKWLESYKIAPINDFKGKMKVVND
jgi:excisionase family DNA binding protein